MFCSGVDFSKFKKDGSDIYPFAAHAYDAVYAVATALHVLHSEKALAKKSSSLLLSTFYNNVTLQGATGLIEFYTGNPQYPYEARGDRETGHTYELYNFQPSAYDSSGGASGLVLVGKWTPENNTQLCELSSSSSSPSSSSPSSGVLDGDPCFAIVYNTKDMSRPRDAPPDIFVTLSGAMKVPFPSLSLSLPTG